MLRKVKLSDICKPKRYKTISKSEFVKNGKYFVYGANGIIGKTDKFTHENPTLMVTGVGATCGSLNISKPKSYINGNAIAFDDINEKFDLKYLYYQLLSRGFNDIITGTAQPQITIGNLKNIEILEVSLEKQKKIAKILDKANELIKLRKTSISKLDILAKSIFTDIFGDPVTNPKNWEIKKLKEITEVKTGKTPSRNESLFWKNGTELWATTTEVNKRFIYDTQEKITKYAVEKCNLSMYPKNTIFTYSISITCN